VSTKFRAWSARTTSTWDFGTVTPLQRNTALGERRVFTEQEVKETEEAMRAANEKTIRPVDLSKGGPPIHVVL
jgi:hypothetical protein